jgi:catechol 2,3-dioxygenase-like lactoylglutathione lyase family enzyme
MAVTLNHTIVPAHDKVSSAQFLAEILGVPFEGLHGHFAPVRVGGVALDFDDRDHFESHHYAFLVSEAEFDQMFGRIQAKGLTYGSLPGSQDDMQINHRRGGRGVYFKDANGHSWELLTQA